MISSANEKRIFAGKSVKSIIYASLRNYDQPKRLDLIRLYNLGTNQDQNSKAKPKDMLNIILGYSDIGLKPKDSEAI